MHAAMTKDDGGACAGYVCANTPPCSETAT